MLLTGIGVGLTLPTLMATGTASLPAHSFATGSAVVNMFRQIGLAVGVAILIAVLGSPHSPLATLDGVPPRLGGRGGASPSPAHCSASGCSAPDEHQPGSPQRHPRDRSRATRADLVSACAGTPAAGWRNYRRGEPRDRRPPGRDGIAAGAGRGEPILGPRVPARGRDDPRGAAAGRRARARRQRSAPARNRFRDRGAAARARRDRSDRRARGARARARSRPHRSRPLPRAQRQALRRARPCAGRADRRGAARRRSRRPAAHASRESDPRPRHGCSRRSPAKASPGRVRDYC